jgi:O-acetyl-ADP-ribose deacetylase (regulator of RNase III)
MEKNNFITTAKTVVSLVLGDITETPCDAIITPVNTLGRWFGDIDEAIQRKSAHYHTRLATTTTRKNLGCNVIKGSRDYHDGLFDHVVFVFDDLESPLQDVILAGLKAADDAGFATVTLPAMRTGVMAGEVEKTVKATVEAMRKGVERFLEQGPTSVKHITFVIYDDRQTLALMTDSFKEAL